MQGLEVARPSWGNRLSGLYAVLDREDEQLARELASVACVLQVRLKPREGSVDPAMLVRVARMARRICDEAEIPLIVNDRVDVALVVGADGVHLGQSDLPIEEARRISKDLVIGVSTHDLEQVRRACAAGADYLGFGPVFATGTKRNPDPIQGLAGLRAAVGLATVPVVAIGGITTVVAREVRDTGVAAICAIAAVNEAPNVAAAARQMLE
jgi:thiamine-phosphate pyrophosphorylase